jgi:hypothetical protein
MFLICAILQVNVNAVEPCLFENILPAIDCKRWAVFSLFLFPYSSKSMKVLLKLFMLGTKSTYLATIRAVFQKLELRLTNLWWFLPGEAFLLV